MIEALQSLLQCLLIPFELAKSSDELKVVPNMKLVFNQLCHLVKCDVNAEADPNGDIISAWETARQAIIDTICSIASQGVEEIKDKEQTEEDKLIHGVDDASPLQRLYKWGNRNLKQLAQSEVPATLCFLLTEDHF